VARGHAKRCDVARDRIDSSVRTSHGARQQLVRARVANDVAARQRGSRVRDHTQAQRAVVEERLQSDRVRSHRLRSDGQSAARRNTRDVGRARDSRRARNGGYQLARFPCRRC
jgi:hypothetical protein